MPRDSHHRPIVQKNTARSRQYFPYAAARHASPERDNAAVVAPAAANYTALISVAYVRNDGDAASYDLAIPRKPSKMTRNEREALLESLLLDEPELTFTPRGNPDPRLLRLVDFLARQAARECYADEVKMMRRRRKRTS